MRMRGFSVTPATHVVAAPRYCFVLLLFACASISSAQTVTTNITSSGLGTNVSTSGATTTITGGTRPNSGANLFHSFGEFSVATGHTADFNNNTGAATTNILSRVTGGNVSNIFGTLKTTNFGAAALWLINPAGVVFGPTASLNVGGSVHISTADYLRLGTGNEFFFADLTKNSTLASAPVTAFGFLGLMNRGDISIQGNLSVPPGENQSFVGGPNTFTNLSFQGGAAQLSAPGGQITIAAVNQSANVNGELVINSAGRLDPALTPKGQFLDLQYLTVSGSAQTSVTITPTVNQTDIAIQGGQLVLAGSLSPRNLSIITPNTGAVTLVAPNTSASIFGGSIDSDAGNITVQTGTLTVNGSIRNGTGVGGTTTLTAADAVTVTGTISASANFNLFGTGGPITLTTPSLTVRDGGTISSDVAIAAVKATSGGNIDVNVGNLNLSAGGTISSSSIIGQLPSKTDFPASNLFAGTGGAILIRGQGGADTSAKSVLIDGASSGIFSQTSTAGNAGIIRINTDSIVLTNGAQISSSSISNADNAGSAGSVTIQGATGPASAANFVGLDNSTISTTIEGGSTSSTPANISVNAQTLSLKNGAQITADTNGAAPAGDVTLTSDKSIVLTGGSHVTSSSSFGTGSAGRLILVVPTMSFEQSSSLQTSTFGAGKAGDIAVSGRTVQIESGSLLNSSTSGPGNAGTITVTALDAVTIAGTDSATGLTSRVASTSSAFLQPSGAAGSISIDAPKITITDQANVTTSNSVGSGRAGDIQLAGNDILIQNGAQVESATFSSATGGTIVLNGRDSVTILGSGLSDSATRLATTTFFGGSGGVITVNTKQLTIDGAELQAVTGGSGQAGNIALSGHDAVISGGTQIDSSSLLGTGKAGAINVTSSNSLTVSGQRPGGASSTRIASSGFVAGDAGTVTLSSPIINLVDGAEVRTGGSGSADAGAISVNGRQVLITRGSFLDSSTFGSGIGGSVAVTATESVTISGRDATGFLSGITTLANGAGDAGQISMTTPSLQLLDGANLSSNTAGAGNAGSIQLNVGQLSLVEGASVTSRARTLDGQPAVSGSGGSITVLGQSGIGTTANTVALDNARFVTSSEGSGDGGSIRLNSGSLNLTNGSLISATNEGTGDAGSVALQVGGLFSSQGSTVSSSAAQGAGGNVTITSGTMNLAGGTTISAESAGLKNAGSIALTSASDLLVENSAVTTFAAQASGGDIKLTAPGTVLFDNARITSSVNGPAGSNGGNISIDPQFVVLKNGTQILAQAQGGNGGNISLVANTFLAEPGTVIDASSALGISGTINIQSPVQNLSGAIAPLPQNLISSASLYAQRCAAQKGGQFSSLTQGTRDGVPPQPGEYLSSPFVAELPGIVQRNTGDGPRLNLSAQRLGLNLEFFNLDSQSECHG